MTARARRAIHSEVCEKGYHQGVRAFTHSYGSEALDASILRLPLVGFLPADDARVVSTLEAVERQLLRGGFVPRYLTDEAGSVDGLSGGEVAFLPCTFWLADNLPSGGPAGRGARGVRAVAEPAQWPWPVVRGI